MFMQPSLFLLCHFLDTHMRIDINSHMINQLTSSLDNIMYNSLNIVSISLGLLIWRETLKMLMLRNEMFCGGNE